MKKILILIIGFNFCFAHAQKNDSIIVMTVGDIEVPLSEFLFIAQKEESGVNLLDKKSRENYIELFKIFKLKVADAMSMGIQESLYFQNELATYQSQLAGNYLSDPEGEEQAMRKVYEQSKELLSISHILFRLPEKSLTKDTLEVFNKANEVYKRILAGEDFTTIGQALMEDENSGVIYQDENNMFPIQIFREIADQAFIMSSGEISSPVRSPLGFHIIRLNQKIDNTETLLVAHILLQAPEDITPEDEQSLLKDANDIYEKITNGEDFATLAERYSNDENTKYNGGTLPVFGLGNMVLPFEQAAFALENIGDVSKPVRTRFGYHIIKLIEKGAYPSFEELAATIYSSMKDGDLVHDLHKVFDDRQKEKMGYIFYQDAYNELLKLCDDYFPTDTVFFSLTYEMSKPLMQLQGKDFPQYEFVDFIRFRATSSKTYSVDFLNDQYALFVREILKKLIEMNAENDPVYINLMNEYHDGILFFEASDTKVWSKPVEEQEDLEREWLKELNQKYKVTINKKVLNNLKKYL